MTKNSGWHVAAFFAVLILLPQLCHADEKSAVDKYASYADIPAPLQAMLDDFYGPALDLSYPFHGSEKVYREEFVAKAVGIINRAGRGSGFLDAESVKTAKYGINLDQRDDAARKTLADLLALDPNNDGRLTTDEMAGLAKKTFAAIDHDSDGTLSTDDFIFLRAEKQKAILATRCAMPVPAADEKILYLSAFDGRYLATYTVAGQDKTTTAIDINVKDGPEKIYLVVSATKPLIWKMEGKVSRVSRMVVLGPQDEYDKKSAGKVLAGAAGVLSDRLSFYPLKDCLPPVFDNKDTPLQTAAKQLHVLFGKFPDFMLLEDNLMGADITGGSISARQDVTNYHAPAGFDKITWAMFVNWSIQKDVLGFDAGSVIAGSTAEPYAVLPGYAGVAQLVASGALIHNQPVLPSLAKVLRGDPTPYGDQGFEKNFFIAQDIPAFPADSEATYIVAKGVKVPDSRSRRGCVISQETGLAMPGGDNCSYWSFPVRPPSDAGSCTAKNDPAFKERIRQTYMAYKDYRPAAQMPDRDEQQGTDKPDVFFPAPGVDTAAFYGKGGDDAYFLPVRTGDQSITEAAQAGETNTVVVTDMGNSLTPPEVYLDADKGLSLTTDTRKHGSIHIRNWFNDKGDAARPVRCFVFMPGYDVLSADDIEALGRAQHLSKPSGQTREVPPYDISFKPSPLLFGRQAPETQVEYVGIYEPQDASPRPPGVTGNKYGTVYVNLRKTAAPVLLVLSSYEPVHWVVASVPGAKISGILLLGYYPQSVEAGGQAVPVVNMAGKSSGFYAYDEGTFQTAQPQLEKKLGLPRQNMTFQGAYHGSIFDIF